MKLPLALALAALLLAPVALAHVESYNQTRTLTAGPYLVFLEPRPSPPFAGNVVSMVAQVSDASTGGLLPRINTTILVAGPDGFSERKRMESDGTGYLVASMTLPETGNYSARVFVVDPDTNETFAAQTEFEVFANIPYRIRAVDQVIDAIEGERSTLVFEAVDPLTLSPQEVPEMRLLMQHWSEDHTTLLGEAELVGERVSKGVWRYQYVFPDKGMFHMRFGSDAAGFNYSETPPLHIYALGAEDAGTIEEKESPGAALGALLALVGVAALLRKR